MYSTPAPLNCLCIWQQNLNKSHMAQLTLLNSPLAKQWDILVLQELVIDHCLGLIKANLHWRLVYPTDKYTQDTTPRAITLVNAKLSTNCWEQIPFLSRDVIIIQFQEAQGACTIFNIYNNGTHNRTLAELSTFLSANIAKVCPSQNDHMFWLGDFNRHHPMWDKEQLTELKKKANQLSHQPYKYKALPSHPCHTVSKKADKMLVNKIFKTKKEHWQSWLEESMDTNFWMAHHYINSSPGDGSHTQVPTLTRKDKQGNTTIASTNEKNGKMLAKMLFPPSRDIFSTHWPHLSRVHQKLDANHPRTVSKSNKQFKPVQSTRTGQSSQHSPQTLLNDIHQPPPPNIQDGIYTQDILQTIAQVHHGDPMQTRQARLHNTQGVLTNCSTQHDSKAAISYSSRKNIICSWGAQSPPQHPLQRSTRPLHYWLTTPLQDNSMTCMETRQSSVGPVSWHQRCLPQHSHRLSNTQHAHVQATKGNHLLHRMATEKQENAPKIWWLHLRLGVNHQQYRARQPPVNDTLHHLQLGLGGHGKRKGWASISLHWQHGLPGNRENFQWDAQNAQRHVRMVRWRISMVGGPQFTFWAI